MPVRRGSQFARRRRERELEKEEDERDRQKEKEEIEALRLEVMERQVKESKRREVCMYPPLTCQTCVTIVALRPPRSCGFLHFIALLTCIHTLSLRQRVADGDGSTGSSSPQRGEEEEEDVDLEDVVEMEGDIPLAKTGFNPVPSYPPIQV